MSKPIEPGCLAIIVAPYSPEMRGVIVTVQRKAAPLERISNRSGTGFNAINKYGYASATSWVVDSQVLPDEFPRIIGGFCLRRIDDGGLVFSDETAELSKILEKETS